MNKNYQLINYQQYALGLGVVDVIGVLYKNTVINTKKFGHLGKVKSLVEIAQIQRQVTKPTTTIKECFVRTDEHVRQTRLSMDYTQNRTYFDIVSNIFKFYKHG